MNAPAHGSGRIQYSRRCFLAREAQDRSNSYMASQASSRVTQRMYNARRAAALSFSISLRYEPVTFFDAPSRTGTVTKNQHQHDNSSDVASRRAFESYIYRGFSERASTILDARQVILISIFFFLPRIRSRSREIARECDPYSTTFLSLYIASRR